MIQFNLIPQKVSGKPKCTGVGVLTVQDKVALFFSDDAGLNSKLLGTLEHPEIIFMNSVGILIKGFEPCGSDKSGRQKFNYQEWYCTYKTDLPGGGL